MTQPRSHGPDHHPGGGADPSKYIPHKVKLTGDKADDDPPIVDPRVWTIPIEPDTNELFLREMFVAVGTAATGGPVKIDITNETQSQGLLTAPAGVGTGTFWADCSSFIISPPDSQVFTGDLLVIEITDADSDARGLTVTLFFW